MSRTERRPFTTAWMSKPVAVVARVIDPPAMTARQRSRRDLRWGLTAAVFLVVLALIAVGIYVLTPGQVRVHTQFAEAGQIRVGDNVRLAGVPVGTVKKIELADDHVNVDLSVDDGVFVGDESRADVKMLTIVGGNYIDITSVGRAPLGKKVIPVSKTSIPYSLMNTFQTVSPKIDKLDGKPLRETLVQLDQGLDENPGSLRANLTTLSSMLTNLDRRQDDFGRMLELAADYSERLNASGDVITGLLRGLSSFVSEYQSFGERLNVVLFRLSSVVRRLHGAVMVYQGDLEPLVDKIDAIGREFGPALRRYTPMITQGRDLIKRLEGMVGPDGSIAVDKDLMLSSDICVPLPGMAC
ncbi:MCE family protein [Gordonia sp. CPCC 206044]